MPAQRTTDAINEQISYEFAASQQYVAIAVHYDGSTLPQLAAFFYRQSLEERQHALMMVQFLLDAGTAPTIPGATAPRTDFEDVEAPIRLALEQEERVTEQIGGLVAIAREEHDYTAEQFLQWFVKEQVEEVSTMSSLATVARRCRDDVMELEEYIAREHGGAEAEDPTAPPAAGG